MKSKEPKTKNTGFMETAARDRVKELKTKSRKLLLLLHRSKHQGREWNEDEAPTSWLIYDIVRLEFGEAIAHKVANKNETK